MLTYENDQDLSSGSCMDVVVVRLEHSHSFIDSFENHSTASGPASCGMDEGPPNISVGHAGFTVVSVYKASVSPKH